MYNAVDRAIKALEPDEEVNEFACPFCGDVTYTATDYVPRFCQECGRDMGFREADIDKAPAVEPADWQVEFLRKMLEKIRPQGKWEEIKTNPPEFDGHRFYICSECGREIDVIIPDESLDDYPYCHCGARMIKGAEKNDNK